MKNETVNNHLAQQAGVPYGAHAFVIVQTFPGGQSAERAYLAGGQADAMREEAETQAARRRQSMPESSFEVIEVGAPVTREKALAALIADGCTFSEMTQAWAGHQAATEPELKAYVDACPDKAGACEVEGAGIVSKGADAGAYVMTWTWVTDEAAGMEVVTIWTLPHEDGAEALGHFTLREAVEKLAEHDPEMTVETLRYDLDNSPSGFIELGGHRLEWEV